MAAPTRSLMERRAEAIMVLWPTRKQPTDYSSRKSLLQPFRLLRAMSETSLNTFESRPELLNAWHGHTCLLILILLSLCLRFLCRSITHWRGSQYSLPHRMFRILGRLCFRIMQPRAGPRLRFSILKGSVSVRPLVGGLASHSGSPATASGEPLLGP